jgi:hypothetical protein
MVLVDGQYSVHHLGWTGSHGRCSSIVVSSVIACVLFQRLTTHKLGLTDHIRHGCRSESSLC